MLDDGDIPSTCVSKTYSGLQFDIPPALAVLVLPLAGFAATACAVAAAVTATRTAHGVVV